MCLKARNVKTHKDFDVGLDNCINFTVLPNNQEYSIAALVKVDGNTQIVFAKFEEHTETMISNITLMPVVWSDSIDNNVDPFDLVFFKSTLYFATTDGNVYKLNSSVSPNNVKSFFYDCIGNTNAQIIGFIYNQAPFVATQTEIFIIVHDKLISFYKYNDIILGVSLSPMIIFTRNKNTFVVNDKLYIYDKSTKSKTEKEFNKGEEYDELMKEVLFERINLVKYRGQELQNRQEKIQSLFSLVNRNYQLEDLDSAKIKELEDLYKKLLDRVLNLHIFNKSKIEKLKTERNNLKNEYENHRKDFK